MRKKILAFVFAAALLVAMAVPVFGGGGTALARQDRVLVTHERGNAGFVEICVAEDAAVDHLADHEGDSSSFTPC